jgi:hypothetical protein
MRVSAPRVALLALVSSALLPRGCALMRPDPGILGFLTEKES